MTPQRKITDLSVSRSTREANPGMFPSTLEDDLRAGKEAKSDVRAEKELQLQCEGWLMLRGYYRLTAHNLSDKNILWVAIGWFGHWPKANRNPTMPDLAVLNRVMTRCILVELKVEDRYQPGQRDMIDNGFWLEARTLDGLIKIVTDWENAEWARKTLMDSD